MSLILWVVPPLVLGALWLAVRVWRGKPTPGEGFSDSNVWLLGDAARNGSRASFPAMALGFSSLMVGYLIDDLVAAPQGTWARRFVDGALLFGLAMVLISFAVLLFMRPRFLVPPGLRDRHGYVVALSRARRGEAARPAPDSPSNAPAIDAPVHHLISDADGVSASEGRVVFYRERTWQDALRSYNLIVDGRPVGRLRAKGRLTIPAEAGAHSCRATIAWYGSPEVNVEVRVGHETRVLVRPAVEASLTAEGYLTMVQETVSQR
jgi:hypothetical protein